MNRSFRKKMRSALNKFDKKIARSLKEERRNKRVKKD